MRSLRAVLATLLLCVPAGAMAQSSVLQGGAWTKGRVPMYLPGGTSQPVIGDSGPAGGGGPGLGLSELNITARGTGTPPYSGQGTGPYGTIACLNDVSTTNATGYHYLCMSPNAQGGGLLAYGAGGGASQLPMNFIVNGTSYQFPFTVTGVVGPGTTTVGDTACWNNTSGTLLSDCALKMPGSGTINRTPNSKLQELAWSPQDFDALAGSGGSHDDAPAINSAVAAAIAAGGTAYLPPTASGYQICSDFIHITGGLNLVGPGASKSGIRVMPGCMTPPQKVIYILAGYNLTPKTAYKVSISDLRVDGYGLSAYNIYDDYSVGTTLHNVVLRNVAPYIGTGTGSANYYKNSGYSLYIDYSVRMENYNDAGHTIYSYGTFPDYNFRTHTTDSEINAEAVGATVANFYQDFGGNNKFFGAHGWGFPASNSEGQPKSYPQYNFLIHGAAEVIGSIADSFSIAGIKIASVGDTGGGQVIGNRCMGFVDVGSSCIEIDAATDPLVHWHIVGNNTQGISGATSNIIKIDGTLSTSLNVVRDNGWVPGGTQVVVGGPMLGHQEIAIGSTSTNVYVSCLAASEVGTDPCTINNFVNGSAGQWKVSVNGTNNFTIAETGVFSGVPVSHPAGIRTGTPPTNSGTCAINTQSGGNTAGVFRANGACAAGTIILTFAANAISGWSCHASDLTTIANNIKQIGYSVNSATFNATMTSGDYVSFDCIGF